MILATAHVTQLKNGSKRTDWFIRENQTSKDIHALPSRLTEAEVFDILGFARKYELQAFNEGVDLQKAITVQLTKEYEAKFQAQVHENIRLADTLERITNKEA